MNIIVNGPVTASNSWITVPENAYVNFYGADFDSSLNIGNIVGTFTIGNSTNSGYTNGNFGNITFNSGIYTVTNTTGVPIGSNTNSGGTITVNAAANVTANNNWNNSPPVAAVGVNAANQKCEIQVNGGLLQATRTDGTKTGSRVVSTGNNGTVTISGQGKILSAVNPNDSDGYGIWNIDSGIAGYTLGTNQWGAVVGGEVTLPVEPDVLQQDLTPPAHAQNGCWNLLTVNPGAVLNLGTTDPGGTATLLVGYSYCTPTTLSTVNNSGIVNITALKQTDTSGNALYPADWNNLQGSELTIGEDQTLYFTSKFTNSASASGKSEGQVTVNGTLSGYQTGVVTNNGDVTINQNGEITNINSLESTDNAFAELDGTVTLNPSGSSFQNSGTLDIGPIGTVNGNLTNNTGGIVTSQNPCYYDVEIPL